VGPDEEESRAAPSAHSAHSARVGSTVASDRPHSQVRKWRLDPPLATLGDTAAPRRRTPPDSDNETDFNSEVGLLLYKGVIGCLGSVAPPPGPLAASPLALPPARPPACDDGPPPLEAAAELSEDDVGMDASDLSGDDAAIPNRARVVIRPPSGLRRNRDAWSDEVTSSNEEVPPPPDPDAPNPNVDEGGWSSNGWPSDTAAAIFSRTRLRHQSSLLRLRSRHHRRGVSIVPRLVVRRGVSSSE
jgi:hypothetical protein